MDLELISFKLCPFVQSSVITLLHKQVGYRITYIDISDPPAWFDEISPTGQVPLVRIDNDSILFESAVINEFLDEVTGGGMMPSEPLIKAQNRAWTQFCGSILADARDLAGAKDENSLQDKEYDIHEKLGRIEALKTDEDFFNGDEMNLIDTLYAALFMRLDLLRPAVNLLGMEQYPGLSRWSENLLRLDAVQRSVVTDFNDIYRRMFKAQGGILAARLP